jgi:hypothetical protein
MVFTSADAEYFVEVLDRILSERAALP